MSYNKLHYYTCHIDGACSNNHVNDVTTRNMAIGAVLTAKDERGQSIRSSEQRAVIDDNNCSNNRAELYALIHILNIKWNRPVQVISDSKYLVDGVTGKTKRKANTALWLQIDFGISKLTTPIKFKWVSRKNNAVADRLATRALTPSLEGPCEFAKGFEWDGTLDTMWQSSWLPYGFFLNVNGGYNDIKTSTK